MLVRHQDQFYFAIGVITKLPLWVPIEATHNIAYIMCTVTTVKHFL